MDRVDVRRVVQMAREGQTRNLADLVAWLGIPSISGDPSHAADLARSASFFGRALKSVGAQVYQHAGSKPPLIVGIVPGRVSRPAVLVYGHYDVVPAGSGWSSAPFAASVRDGRLIGRGANDDKGQLFAVVAALRAWRHLGGPPGPVLVVAEGAEEVGGAGLAAGLRALADRLHPDLVLACDTERHASGVPTVTVSQRGHARLQVSVDVGGAPVHSGRLGGAVLDPSLLLSRVLVSVRRALPSICAGTSKLSHTNRIHVLTDDEVRVLAPGRRVWSGDLDRRITRCAALTVVRVGLNADGAAVPSRATATWDLRLPASCDVARAVGRLVAVARRSLPGGLVSVRVLDSGAGFEGIARPAALRAVNAASVASFGQPALLIRSGGSLAASHLLERAFGQVPVLLGLGTAGGRAHGPDEWLDIPGWQRCVDLLVRLIGRPLMPACEIPQKPWADCPDFVVVGPPGRSG